MTKEHLSITVEHGYTVQEVLDRIIFYHDEYRQVPIRASYHLFPRLLPKKQNYAIMPAYELTITLIPCPRNPFALSLENILQGDPETLLPPQKDLSVLEHCERLMDRYCYPGNDIRLELRGRIVNIFSWDAHEPAELYQGQILEFFLKNLEFLTLERLYQKQTLQNV